MWTEERVERLKTLWEQGLSASKIAETMGDTTRNAVIGKVSRLKLPLRPTTVRKCNSGRGTTRRAKKQTNFKGAPQRAASTRHIKVDPTWVDPKFKSGMLDKDEVSPTSSKTVLDLEPNECRWPYGHVEHGGVTFCAKPTNGSSYCTDHSQVNAKVVPTTPSKRKPPVTRPGRLTVTSF